MQPNDVIALLFVLLIPTVLIIYIAKRFFAFREKKLEVEALNAAEKAAQYASRSSELEERVRVLEQIVTDGGLKPPPRSRRSARRRERVRSGALRRPTPPLELPLRITT
jgi:hypothetical protein